MITSMAVLSGDIVGSTSRQAPPMVQIHSKIKQIADRLGNAQGVLNQATVLGLGTFRGDAFQIAVTPAECALRAAIFIRAGFLDQIELDTRIAIGVGEFEPVTAIETAHSPAFILSGRALDAILSKRRLVAAAPVSRLAKVLDICCEVSDDYISNWTRNHARAVYHRFQSRTQAEAGAQMELSQSDVSRALKGAGWQILLQLAALWHIEVEAAFLDTHLQPSTQHEI